MDIFCAYCQEPWEFDYIIDDNCLNNPEFKFFENNPACILRCPVCIKKNDNDADEETKKERTERIQKISVLGELLGNDIDGIVAMMDDLN